MNNHLLNDKITLKPMITLFKAHKELMSFIKNDIKDTSFDINEFGVLEVIYHKKEITISNIKNKILLANSSLSYILDKLEKRDLIKRVKDGNDKRITYVSLTNKGNLISEKIFPEHYNNLKELFSVLSVEEKEILSNILKKIGKHVENINEL